MTVTYDVVSDAALECINVEGTLAFRTDANTRMKVGTVTVLESGTIRDGDARASGGVQRHGGIHHRRRANRDRE